jgi:hypothetical protein
MAVFEPAPTEANPDHKKRTGEKLVLDPEGQPIRMAEPTFSEEDWGRIQAALGDRTASGKARQMTPNPLAGIGYCVCGSSGAVTLQEAELILQEQFLQAYGDREMTRMVFVPGADHSQELAQTEQSLERLRWESDNGLVDDETLYRSRLTALVARKAELTANTVVPARYEAVGTGRTYRELWADEATDRRQTLRDAGIRLVLHCPPRDTTTQTRVIPWDIRVPEDWPMPDREELPTDPALDARIAEQKRRRASRR